MGLPLGMHAPNHKIQTMHGGFLSPVPPSLSQGQLDGARIDGLLPSAPNRDQTAVCVMPSIYLEEHFTGSAVTKFAKHISTPTPGSTFSLFIPRPLMSCGTCGKVVLHRKHFPPWEPLPPPPLRSRREKHGSPRRKEDKLKTVPTEVGLEPDSKPRRVELSQSPV